MPVKTLSRRQSMNAQMQDEQVPSSPAVAAAPVYTTGAVSGGAAISNMDFAFLMNKHAKHKG